MEIKRIPAGIYAANCYLLVDDTTKECAVIDPGGDAEKIIKTIKSLNVNVRGIFLTHGHVDHTEAVSILKEEYKVAIYMNIKDKILMEKGSYIFGNLSSIDIHKDIISIEEGQSFKLGKLNIKYIETPGHTPGGMCFLVDNVIFTGDTLFLGSIGRTDFEGGDYETLINSIKNKLLVLADDIIVLPGHGAESSIGYEKVHNPFL